jgi:hypothetical protein
MTEQLPIELECFLLKHGFFEIDQVPGVRSQVPVKRQQESQGWKPAYEGDDPPF